MTSPRPLLASFLALFLFCATATAFPVDFDGDGKTDPTVWRPATGMWYMLPSTGFCPAEWTVIGPGQCQKRWGLPNDTPLVGDFDQDGKGDVTVRRPSNQHFYISYSSFPGSAAFQFPDGSGGVQPEPSDIPDVADVNHDGRSDVVIYKPSTTIHTRAYARVFANNAITVYSKGLSILPRSTILPIEAAAQNYIAGASGQQWFGEEIGLAWRQTGSQLNASWRYVDIKLGTWIQKGGTVPNASSQRLARGNFSGLAYDTHELALFDTSTGMWRYLRTGSVWNTLSWGLPGDIPVPGDYTGNGITDFAVWRPSTGTWFILVSPCPQYSQPTGYGGCFRQWGLSNDIPVAR